MKIGVFRRDNGASVAIHADDRWFDFGSAYRHIATEALPGPVSTILALIQAGQFSKHYFENALESLDERALLHSYELTDPPALDVPIQPGKIICVGRNYLAHAQETGHDAPAEPMFFAKSPQACIAGGASIVAKPEYGRVDHEGELAVIIGKKATAVPEDAVKDYIAGYTLLNDVTARDMQKQAIEQRYPWFLSKSIDTFCPIGPVIVPRDVLGWPVEVDIELRVNGEVRQASNTRKFIFPIPRLIAYLTKYITLLPGDVIATGTPEGISPIKPGDLVELSVPEIGVLRNPVSAA